MNKLAERINSVDGASWVGTSTRRMVLAGRALAVWNLFVWGGRIRNLAADPGGLAEAGRWSLVGSIGFCLLALVVLGLAVAARIGRGSPDRVLRGERVIALIMAVLGVVVWAYRGVVIAGGGYSFGFIAVHTVLALVTIGLGLLVVAPDAAGER